MCMNMYCIFQIYIQIFTRDHIYNIFYTNISCIMSFYLVHLYECLAKHLYILLYGYNNIWLQHSRSIFCFHIFWQKGKNTIALEIIYIMMLKICNKLHAYAHKRSDSPLAPPKKEHPKKARPKSQSSPNRSLGKNRCTAFRKTSVASSCFFPDGDPSSYEKMGLPP